MFAGFSRIKTGVDVVLRGVEHRGELAGLELEELRSELATTGVLAATAGAAFLLGGIALTLLVAAIYWDTPHRVSALGWLAPALAGVASFRGHAGTTAPRYPMSASDNSEPPGLTREQRIHLLRLACASDRLELALTARPAPPSMASRILRGFDLHPWLELASGFAAPLLPRKLRMLLTVARLWRNARSPHESASD
jgi:hypothetical protein